MSQRRSLTSWILRRIWRWRPCFRPLSRTKRSAEVYEPLKIAHLSLQTSRGRSPVQDGLSAAVQVVKLLLGHRVVHVHGGHAEFPGFGELIQPGEKRAGGWSARLLCGGMLLSGSNSPVNSSDTLLYDAPDLLEYIWVFLVHPVCQVPSIIKDLTSKKDANGWKWEQVSHLGDIYSTRYYHVGLPALSVDTAINAPPEIILRLPFPGKHRHAWNIAHVNLTFSDHFIRQHPEQRLYNTHRTPKECL